MHETRAFQVHIAVGMAQNLKIVALTMAQVNADDREQGHRFDTSTDSYVGL